MAPRCPGLISAIGHSGYCHVEYEYWVLSSVPIAEALCELIVIQLRLGNEQ